MHSVVSNPVAVHTFNFLFLLNRRLSWRTRISSAPRTPRLRWPKSAVMCPTWRTNSSPQGLISLQESITARDWELYVCLEGLRGNCAHSVLSLFMTNACMCVCFPQVITLQSYVRRWLAKCFTDSLRQAKEQHLTWLENEKRRKKEEKKQQIRDEYHRRMNPESKADFDLLYNALKSECLCSN